VGQEPDVASSLAAIDRCQKPQQLKDAYSALLKNASPKRIRELKKNPHVGLALCAAWREALRTGTPTQGYRATADPAFAKFVGFVDGRLPVDIPEWWEINVATSMITDDHGVAYHRHDPYPWIDIKARILLPKGVSIKAVDDGTEIGIGNTRVVLPAKVLEQARVSLGMVSPVVDGDSVFVVAGTSGPSDAPILCRIERNTNKILWVRELWTGGRLTSISLGPMFVSHLVEPVVGRDGNVYVFGTAAICAYIEGFSRTDGTVRLRFSTAYAQELY
jgi:hypothetical protein